MVQTPKYLLVQERLGVDLEKRLLFWREHGVSNEAMARMLQAETEVSLTGQTIADWFSRIASVA